MSRTLITGVEEKKAFWAKGKAWRKRKTWNVYGVVGSPAICAPSGRAHGR